MRADPASGLHRSLDAPETRRVDVTRTFSHGFRVAVLPAVAFWVVIGEIVWWLA